MPIADSMVHHYSCKCPCNPIRDSDDDRTWIHNAFDGRDFLEADYGNPQ